MSCKTLFSHLFKALTSPVLKPTASESSSRQAKSGTVTELHLGTQLLYIYYKYIYIINIYLRIEKDGSSSLGLPSWWQKPQASSKLALSQRATLRFVGRHTLVSHKRT